MRALPLALCVSLAACGGGGEKRQPPPPEPTPSATAPAPKTPVMQITPLPGDAPKWMEPRPDPGATLRAPYEGRLDRPVVEGRR